jgi:hypothetical protein
LNIISKNARSLCSDGRVEEALEELSGGDWDVNLFSETWRLEVHGDDKLEAGHRWIGAGGARKSGSTGGKHGVGILLHARWASSVSKVGQISPRICFVDLCVKGRKLRLLCACMQHTGYADQAVEEVYDELDRCIKEARAQRKLVIVAGDWNAEVGAQHPGEKNSSVGCHGFGRRNHRGQMFANWCTSQSLVIANTMYRNCTHVRRCRFQ